MTNSRQKGKRGELMASKELKRLFGCEARRGQQYCGAAGDADIITSIEGIHFEVKNVESLSLHKALEQAEADKKYSEVPVVLHKKNRKDWVVICYLEDLGEVSERINKTTEA